MVARHGILPVLVFALVGAGCGDDGAVPVPSQESLPASAVAVAPTAGPSAASRDHEEAPISIPLRATPPAPGALIAPDGEGSATFAISKVYLGEYLRDGTYAPADAWMHYGFDIDGTLSNGDGAQLCKPRAGATADHVHTDGMFGIDNSFGKHVLPRLSGLPVLASWEANALLGLGDSRMLLDLDQLGASPDYHPLRTRGHLGRDLEYPPLYDGSDVWPVSTTWLEEHTDPSTSVMSAPDGYVVGDVWVSGVLRSVPLHIPTPGGGIEVIASWAMLTMRLSPDRQTASDGTIAAAIPIGMLQSGLMGVAAWARPCDHTGLQTFLDGVEAAADIMTDGTQDPTKECDAVSIGIGFDATRVVLGDPDLSGKLPPGGRPPCVPPPG